MTKSIYDQHTAAFANVSAFVILDKEGNRVATIAFKFPKDGAGRLWCYLHIIGLEMARGSCAGYGYDKKSAAAWNAIKEVKVTPRNEDKRPLHSISHDFMAALRKGDDGAQWDNALRDAGYIVMQAV